MPLKNDVFYKNFRDNNYDFENLFKAYKSLGDELVKNFRQTEDNLTVLGMETYRIIPKQFIKIGGAQYDTNIIRASLSDEDAIRFENRISNLMPPLSSNKYYNTWDMTPTDTSKFIFKLNDDGITCSVMGLTDNSVFDIVIPYEDSDGHKVTAIGTLFKGNSAITSIAIPSSVVVISAEAFAGCTSLRNIDISYGICEIGCSAFEECPNLEEIDLPNSVEILHDRAFKNCSGLKAVSMSENIVEIGDECFYGCTSLSDIQIPDKIAEISDYAFYNCAQLTKIETPNILSSIGKFAFGGCSKLSAIALHNNLTEIGDFAFSGCSSLNDVFIPNSVRIIGASCFYNCINLSSIFFEDNSSLTSIGNRAFADCYTEYSNNDSIGLTKMVIPNSVMSIGKYAFYNCGKLSGIHLPENKEYTKIETGLLYGCKSLEAIDIPIYVNQFGARCLWDCNNLKTVNLLNETGIASCFENASQKDACWQEINEYTKGSFSTPDSGVSIYTSSGELNISGLQASVNNEDVIKVVDTILSNYFIFNIASLNSGITVYGGEENYQNINDFITLWNVTSQVPMLLFSDRLTEGTITQDAITPIEFISYSKKALKVYEESYPLNRSAYDDTYIMKNKELVSILDNNGKYIEFLTSAESNTEYDSGKVVSFELYDTSERLLVRGLDYDFVNNRLYLFGDTADKNIFDEGSVFSLCNIAIDYETVQKRIGGSLSLANKTSLSKTEFCDALKQYTLHMLSGPTVSALSSASASYCEMIENVNLYDRSNATIDIRSDMDMLGLTPFDFLLRFSENIDYRRLGLFIDYLRVVKPPETNFAVLGVSKYEEDAPEYDDILCDEIHEIYYEDYIQNIRVGNVLHTDNRQEITDTKGYVTYHTGESVNVSTIKYSLTDDYSADYLYIISGGETKLLSVIVNGEEQALNI